MKEKFVPPVKLLAVEHGVRVFQPQMLKEDEFVECMRNIAPEIGIVVAYGKILPPEVLSQFSIGCMNVHFSLLPKYRGPAPIQWAIMNGEQETGVSIFWIDEGIDTGRIILQEREKINFDDTFVSLQERLTTLGINMLSEVIRKIYHKEELPAVSQSQAGQPSQAPKIDKKIAHIDWQKPAVEIYNIIRALIPWPVAYTIIEKNNKILKIYKASIANNIGTYNSSSLPCGAIVDVSGALVVKCGAGYLRLEEVQMEGKKCMSAGEFVRGARLSVGDKLI
jgi:methionyl-tRNA formyltransferase